MAGGGKEHPEEIGTPEGKQQPGQEKDLSALLLDWLRAGETQPGGKLPLYDKQGERIPKALVQVSLEYGLVEPWTAGLGDLGICKLTPLGRKFLRTPDPGAGRRETARLADDIPTHEEAVTKETNPATDSNHDLVDYPQVGWHEVPEVKSSPLTADEAKRESATEELNPWDLTPGDLDRWTPDDGTTDKSAAEEDLKWPHPEWPTPGLAEADELLAWDRVLGGAPNRLHRTPADSHHGKRFESGRPANPHLPQDARVLRGQDPARVMDAAAFLRAQHNPTEINNRKRTARLLVISAAVTLASIAVILFWLIGLQNGNPQFAGLKSLPAAKPAPPVSPLVSPPASPPAPDPNDSSVSDENTSAPAAASATEQDIRSLEPAEERPSATLVIPLSPATRQPIERIVPPAVERISPPLTSPPATSTAPTETMPQTTPTSPQTPTSRQEAKPQRNEDFLLDARPLRQQTLEEAASDGTLGKSPPPVPDDRKATTSKITPLLGSAEQTLPLSQALPSGKPPRPLIAGRLLQASLPEAAADSGRYRLQLLASGNRQEAEARMIGIAEDHADLLRDTSLFIEVFKREAAPTVYRVKAGAFQTRETAQKLCTTLLQRGQDCLLLTSPR